MKTIKSQLIENLQNKDATHIADTVCWNYYANNFGVNSNLAKTLKTLPALDEKYGYLVVVGAKGSSQHSKTNLHIFKAKLGVQIDSYDIYYRDYWFV